MMPKSFRFGSFTLDLERLCLDGPSGHADLRRKSFDVLRYLVEHAGRIVTKEELIKAVWPDVTVSDDSLTQCISEVRRALGEASQQIIKTVPRRGYLFDCPISASDVRTVEPSHASQASATVAVDVAATKPEGSSLSAAAQVVGSGRRQVTVMVCGLGATTLSGRVDPEDLREILAECHTRAREIVEAHGGSVAENLVDGAVFLFGYPQAHEDDAERAVRAGLALTRAGRHPELECLTEPLRARVGIATGVVVVSEPTRVGTGADHVVVGEAPLLASSLLTLAHSGAVLISAGTRRLIGTLFEYRDLGAVELKQIPGPVEVAEVLRESVIASRFEALRSGRAELVGRGDELDLLLRRWQQAKTGDGCVVLLTGEAGIGKSRLTRALQERLAEEPHTPLIYQCSPYHQDSALHPIIGQLLRAADFERDESAETKLDKLEALLTQPSQNLAEDIPLFAALLSIPGRDRHPLPDLNPQRLKALTLGALLRQLKGLAAQTPVLMVFEDLHWIDPTSLDLLSLAVDQVPSLRLLFIATSRPEFKPPWANHRHISTVSLSRLGRSEGQTLVTAITKGRALPPAVLEQILDRTDGIPLFIEELTKTVLESDLLRKVGSRYELIGSLAPLAIPSTLHASLLARLDRLASVKDVAQIGAAIGRDFPYDLIAAISALPEQDLRAALAELVGAEVIFQRGAPPDAMYLFKHALVQETAYASLVRGRRQQLHGHIARTLEERCPDIVATEPEIVAYHFTEADLIEPAIDYWRRAGERFLARSANIEAVKHLSQAIKLLGAMPQTRERLDEELEIRIKMAPALIAVKGVSSTEVEALYLRAQELVGRLGKTSRRFPVFWGLWYVNYNRGQYTAALEAGKRLLDAAQSSDDAGLLLEAHHALWATLSAMGHAADAVLHMERGIALYDQDLHGSHAFIYGGHDAGACCRYHLAVNFWLLGYPDRSLSALFEALRHTEQLKHPMTRFLTLWYAAWIYYQRGDRPAMRRSIEELLALSTEHGISLNMRDLAIVILKIDACSDRSELAELYSELKAKSLAANWQRAFCLCVLAERYNEWCHGEGGLAVLASISAEDSGAIYAPEILRLEGELRRHLPSTDTEEIERCFHAALVLARQRKEKSLELRAAMSLARFWNDQGNRAEARDLLKPVYDWFSEGLDLPDLKKARTLLDDLGCSI